MVPGYCTYQVSGTRLQQVCVRAVRILILQLITHERVLYISVNVQYPDC